MPTAKAATLQDVFRASDPSEPLPSGDDRYVEMADTRGNTDVVDVMLTNILWQNPGVFNCQLFTGHIGCGKSTELLRLKARLEQENYAVIYYEAVDVLDLGDASYTDILLSVARQAAQFPASQGKKIPELLMQQVLQWFSETLYEAEEWRSVEQSLENEAAVGIDTSGLPLLARLLARLVSQIKDGEQIKHTIRQKLDPQITQLIVRINLLLEAAAKAVGKHLVIIVDTLDRIVRKQVTPERSNHETIFIDHAEQLRSLKAHLVFTVPIGMIHSQSAPVLLGYFQDWSVLPMIKSRNRDGMPNEVGLARLRQVLEKRIDLARVFEASAVDLMCEMCGGHPRDLMKLVRYSVRYADKQATPPITLTSVQRAVGDLITEFSRAIPEEHYEFLAQVFLRKAIANDAAHQIMLGNHSVMEYFNGPPPWHDVHPVVGELPKFKNALSEEKLKTGLGSG